MHVFPWWFFVLTRRTEAAEWWQAHWAQSLAFYFGSGRTADWCVLVLTLDFSMLRSCYIGSRDLLFQGLCSAGSTIFGVLSLVGLAYGPASNWAESGHSESTRRHESRHGLRWHLWLWCGLERRCLQMHSSARCSDSQEIENSRDMEHVDGVWQL